MGKKRDGRVTSGSDRHQGRTESPAQRQKQQHKPLYLFIIFFIISSSISVLVYRTKFISSPNGNPNPKFSNLFQQGLVKDDINYQEILTEHSKVSENASLRQFPNPVLAYITPWNNRGYDLAKRFNSKFTYLSPVWYDLKSHGANLVLEGRHNYDVEWIQELRKSGDAKVLPRVVLEASPKELLNKKKQRKKAIDLIVVECKEMGYDGIVLESWSRWIAYGVLHDSDMRSKALLFIRELGRALHSLQLERNGKQLLEFVYVIGPPRSAKLQADDFGPEDLQSLSDAVDGFSLMTYDFSSPHNPGPNAPMEWIKAVLQILTMTKGSRNLAHKIFLGAGGGAIIGRDYLSLLEKHRPALQWEKRSGEHYFFYLDDENIKHAVFYPSLMSISMRLEEAKSWGAGISIWEIGQGLDYFFDLL
ncbi:Glycoside hydrolase family 18, catalytic domain [Dillenia turbinata]|uniref:Chitinase domain-containing protein 1 n=1 Tax=Dillenia turbinata TaxID=194707 RepID=A0AAN8UWS7_9MAGN